MIYKVSYVIKDSKHPGVIINQINAPQIDSEVQIGKLSCRIIEIEELLPSQDEFSYLHVTCQAPEPNSEESL